MVLCHSTAQYCPEAIDLPDQDIVTSSLPDPTTMGVGPLGQIRGVTSNEWQKFRRLAAIAASSTLSFLFIRDLTLFLSPKGNAMNSNIKQHNAHHYQHNTTWGKLPIWSQLLKRIMGTVTTHYWGSGCVRKANPLSHTKPRQTQLTLLIDWYRGAWSCTTSFCKSSTELSKE